MAASRRQFLLGSAGTLLLGCAHSKTSAHTSSPTPATPLDLPQYTRLRAVPGPALNAEVAEAERSPLLMTQATRIMEELRQPPRRPSADQPIVAAILGDRGPITIVHPNGLVLPIFTSPFAPADYRRLLLADTPSLIYPASSATQFVHILRDIEHQIPLLTVDRCPRCEDMVLIPASALKTPDDVIDLCSIFMATKHARYAMYLSFAGKARDDRKLELARDVALAAVAHVALDPLPAHQMLLELATPLGDATLRREAEAYLAFLQRPRGR
jgi:hypothetical protein